MEYPECKKMKEVSEESNKIGEFLEWLQIDKHIILARYYQDVECEHCDEPSEQLLPIRLSTEELLAEYFNIDLNKVEEERRQILNQLRKDNR